MTVVVPTYNERDTVPLLLRRLAAVVERSGLDGEAVVVDDASPDGTGDVAARVALELRDIMPIVVAGRPGGRRRCGGGVALRRRGRRRRVAGPPPRPELGRGASRPAAAGPAGARSRLGVLRGPPAHLRGGALRGTRLQAPRGDPGLGSGRADRRGPVPLHRAGARPQQARGRRDRGIRPPAPPPAAEPDHAPQEGRGL